MRVIDLSHALHEGMPVFQGGEAPSFRTVSGYEREGYLEHELLMSSHAGTHLDAPAHVIPGGKTLDLIPADRFIGRGCVIPARDAPQEITAQRLAAYESSINNAEFILFNTGWSRFWEDARYFSSGFPALTEEAARWLSSFSLKGVAVDAPSVDPAGSMNLAVHKILLGRGVMILENLTGLSEISPGPFLFSCFPLNVRGGDGSPVRAVALADFDL